MILKTRFGLSCRVALVFFAVKFYFFFIYLHPNNRILHSFAILSHFIFAINDHKGKWHYTDDKKTLFVYHVDYRWFNWFLQYISIWTQHSVNKFAPYFSQIVLSNISVVGSSSDVSSTYFIQERDTFHQRVSRIHWKYHHHNSIFVCWHKYL